MPLRICSALLLALALLAQNAPVLPDKTIMSVALPDKIEWRKGGNADTAVLVGSANKPGLYIELVRWHAGNMSRPHSHTIPRYITVISGTWWLGSGPNYDPQSTYPAKPGTFVVHHANQLHYDGAKDEDCVIQIVQINP